MNSQSSTWVQRYNDEQKITAKCLVGRTDLRRDYSSHSLNLGDYEVLVLQVTVATIFDFCFGPTFFLVRCLGASRGDDLYSLTLRGE